MTTREQALAEATWNYLVKDHPWVAKDEYYKKNPHKSMTYNAAIWGATWEAQRSAELVEALEFYANYMSGDNPEFTKMGWQKYPDPRIARAALEKYRGEPWTG